MRLDELAKQLGADLEGDGSTEILALAPIEEAGEGDLTFVANPKYRSHLASTDASAVIVGPGEVAPQLNLLRSEHPYRCFVQALGLFDARPGLPSGVHPSAFIAKSAVIGEGASIGPFAVISDGVVMGRDATIHPHVTIYAAVRIGDRFTAHAGAVVRENVNIGDDVVLQPGVVLGGDGFGFLPLGGGDSMAIPQIGSVDVGNGVDVGANTTIDRAAIGATRLADGVKLDNLVMVGHGSSIGEGTMLAAQCGLSGSTHLGREIMAGGQVGFAGHLQVGDGTQIAGQSGVTKDVAAGQVVGGLPVVSMGTWRRITVALQRLPELFSRVRRLERKVGGD